MARYWLNQAFLSDAIPLPNYIKNPKQYWRIKWTIDGWPWVDPLKDIKAKSEELALGLTSPSRMSAENGDDFDLLQAEIAADEATRKNLGLPSLLPQQQTAQLENAPENEEQTNVKQN